LKVRSYIYSMEKLINKADVFGTVGPFNINGQWAKRTGFDSYSDEYKKVIASAEVIEVEMQTKIKLIEQLVT